MTTDFIASLSKLRAEAEAGDHRFLAHIIGLAILEANRLVAETSRHDGTSSHGSTH
jgi:hypothetical protein